MIKLRHLILLAYVVVSPAIAVEPLASEASVRELLAITSPASWLTAPWGKSMP